MSEQEILELIRRSQEGVPLNDAQKEIIREWLKKRLSQESAKEFLRDAPKPEVPPSAWARLATPKNFVRGGVYLILAYLLIAAVADAFVTPKTIGGGNGPCDISAGTIPAHVDPSATGPNGALNDALTAIQLQCSRSSLKCNANKCPTCRPDATVQTVEIKNRLFWYTAEITGVCQCWCK